MLPTDRGIVTLDGRALTPRDINAHLFYVPDVIAPWPSQSVRWALDYVIGFFGGPAARRADVIARLDLAPLLDAPVGTLSKGQRKRVGLAIGMLTPQPVLLADEPFEASTSGRPRGGHACARTRRRATLVLSIHQIADAARVCDRFVLLSSGRVCGEGATNELAALAASRGHASTGHDLEEISLRSRSAFSWLLAKEWRELVASRAWWIMLALVGPFVGLSFISSVRTYSELSAGSGGAGGAEVFSVLDGIWAPTFSAYELVAMFLLPFVAIRLVSGDRQSGALKLELQQRMSPFTRILAKALVLLAGWMLTGGAAIAAIGLWKLYGGATFARRSVIAAVDGCSVIDAAAAASAIVRPALSTWPAAITRISGA